MTWEFFPYKCIRHLFLPCTVKITDLDTWCISPYCTVENNLCVYFVTLYRQFQQIEVCFTKKIKNDTCVFLIVSTSFIDIICVYVCTYPHTVTFIIIHRDWKAKYSLIRIFLKVCVKSWFWNIRPHPIFCILKLEKKLHWLFLFC